ncbi:hypothetical protein C8A00DRAFT_36343 [Chaetomidium leptoderma]|uniref:Uncharacterized protein n=1 Tax=Chaetomidium leptoderma TaxID=669021 RepID=A0AAN6VIY5_9PEZI|nr:hypothetical protein C8A00DRAFT_36343 [Chaetomidium leptoderma]
MLAHQKGPEYSREDIVSQAWGSILSTYFPQYASPDGGVIYSIRRAAARGEAVVLPQAKPCRVIVIEMAQAPADPWPSLPDPGMSLPPARDILWVACKAPVEDTPAGWKDLMEQCASRLELAHPARKLYVILAIGLKWMMFKWDPRHKTRSPLQMLADHRPDTWAMDSRYRYDSGIAGQSHVVYSNNAPSPDLVDTTLAYSLEFWAPEPDAPPTWAGEQPRPLNWRAMQLLEACFTRVRNTVSVGENDTGFN